MKSKIYRSFSLLSLPRILITFAEVMFLRLNAKVPLLHDFIHRRSEVVGPHLMVLLEGLFIGPDEDGETPPRSPSHIKSVLSRSITLQ
jgi:hypothetical protein